MSKYYDSPCDRPGTKCRTIDIDCHSEKSDRKMKEYSYGSNRNKEDYKSKEYSSSGSLSTYSPSSTASSSTSTTLSEPHIDSTTTTGTSYTIQTCLHTVRPGPQSNFMVFTYLLRPVIIPAFKDQWMFSHLKEINISSIALKDGDINILTPALKDKLFSLDTFDVSNNQLGSSSVENIFSIFGSSGVKHINLSNNYIDDTGAKHIASSFSSGLYPKLKGLNISGNKITSTGEGYLITALKSLKNCTITFVTEQATIGKAALKASLKTFISHAKEQGVDTTNIGVNKSTLEYIKDGNTIVQKFSYGILVNCSTYGYIEGVTAHEVALDVAIKLSKSTYLGYAAIAYCVGLSAYDTAVTPEGVGFIAKALDLIGDSEW